MASNRTTGPGELLQPLTARRTPAVRLFCFPYAGGGVSVYRQWDCLPDTVDIWGVQLPGREERTLERPFARMTEVIDTICARLPDELDGPYAFFGHSMGAIVSWEVARELVRRGLPAPVWLFVSGCRPPHMPDETCFWLLSDDELIDEIRKMDGTPRAVLENRDLMQLLLPTIRADFAVLENRQFQAPEPVDVPITVFGGAEDARVRPEHLAGWRELTRAECETHVFAGGHLFLREERDAILSIMEARIAAALTARRQR